MSAVVYDAPVAGSSTSDQRHRASAEVIDVDDFVEGSDVQFIGHGSSRPLQRTRVAHFGWVAPNGESGPASDQLMHSLSHAPPYHSTRQRSRLFSPPPRPIDRAVPPVPPIPRHLSGETSLPMRVRPPPFPGEATGPVRASSQPFDFEAHIPVNLPQSQSQPPFMAAAPRSHHQPVMGFGGAIIALNRQDAVAESINAQRQREQAFRQRQRALQAHTRMPDSDARRTWNLPSLAQATGFFVDMFRGFPAHPEDRHDDIQRERHDDIHDWLDFMGEFGLGGDFITSGFGLGNGLPRNSRERRPDIEYKPEFTHHGKPESGFSFDFSPPAPPSKSVIVIDETPGQSSSSSSEDTNNVLVCAHCLDPLVVGEINEEAQRQRRVWALRCGHMLDGKCIEEMRKPQTDPDLAEASKAEDGQGKVLPPENLEPPKTEGKRRGKAVASALSVTTLSPKARGKRKFKAEPEVESGVPSTEQAGPSGSTLPDDFSNSIRSRLRSCKPPQPTVPAAAAPSSLESPVHDRSTASRPVRRMPRRRRNMAAVQAGQAPAPVRGRGKGKGKARQPVVEQEYEWICPVAGCGKLHVSLLIDGQWSMDPERGAIALYV